MERQIKFQTARVKEALSELVAKGLILGYMGLNSQTHYQINQKKYEKIKNSLKKRDDEHSEYIF